MTGDILSPAQVCTQRAISFNL